MQKATVKATLTALALGGVLAACERAGVTGAEAVMQDRNGPEATVRQQLAGAQLPFHVDVVNYQFQQVPAPPGRCTEALPPGLDYLWMTRLWGDVRGTHLGTGRLDGSICVYGQLKDAGAPPPDNGIPMGWVEGRIAMIAADGDRLNLTAWSTGVTAPPGTPGFKFIEEFRFVNGGTGRFELADGDGIGYVDPVAQSAVYDGWIRYGRKE